MNFRYWINLWLRSPIWSRLLLIGGIAVAAGIGLYLSVPAIKQVVRESRRNDNMAEARAEAAAGHAQGARTAALAVLLAGHDDPEATRILLDAMETLRDPRLVEVALLVIVSGEQSREDRLHAWEICCREAAMGLVMQAQQILPEELRNDREFRLMLTDRLIAEELFKDALKTIGISEADEKVPLDFDWEQRLVRLLIATGKADAARLAQVRIAERLAKNPSEGDQLAALTDEIPMWQLTSRFHEALVARAAAGAGETADERLRRLRAEAASWLSRREEIIGKMFASSQDDPLTLAHWALRCDQPATAAKLVTPEMAAAGVDAFWVRVEALRRTEQWQACRETLEAAPEGVVEAEIQTELAAVCERLGDRTTVNHAVEEAIIVARLMSETPAMVQLAKFAEKRGVTAIARRAWVEAAKRRVGPLPLYSRLLPMLEDFEAEQREEELAEIVMTYRRVEPGNPLVLVHHHYLALLRGLLTPATAIENLKPIVEKNPTFGPARISQALAMLLSNSPAEETLALLEAGKLDWKTASPPNRALYALVLTRAGRQAEGDAILNSMRWEEMLPSERTVFQGLRRQLTTSGQTVDIEKFMPKQRPPEDASEIDITPFLPKARPPQDMPPVEPPADH